MARPLVIAAQKVVDEELDIAEAQTLDLWRKHVESIQFKGGPGSGNFGHSGRPGKVGGSGGGSGGGAFAGWEKLSAPDRFAKWAKMSNEEREAFNRPSSSIMADQKKRLAFAGDRPSADIPVGQAIDQRIDAIGDYIPEDAANRLKARIRITADTLEAAGVDKEIIHEISMELVDSLAVQENESLSRQLGDHGIRHALGNADMAQDILALHPDYDTPQMRAALDIAAMLHDVGYMSPESKMLFGKDHKASSEAHYDANLKGLVETALGSDAADKVGYMIRTHDSPELDWADPVATSLRIADNVALFHKEKLPGLFHYVPENINVLDRLATNSISLAAARIDMAINIRATSFSAPHKQAMLMAAGRVGEFTPKFTLGMLAGEVDGFKWSENHLRITLHQSSQAKVLHDRLDLGQQQFSKFAEAYGIDPAVFRDTLSFSVSDDDGAVLLESYVVGEVLKMLSLLQHVGHAVVEKQLPIGDDSKKALLELRMNMFKDDLDLLSERVFSGDMSLGQYHEDFKRLMKEARSSAAAIGKGGWDMMGPRDWGRLGTPNREQYKFLRGFIQTIADRRETISLAQIKMRARMYADAIAGATTQAEAGFYFEDNLPWLPRDGSTTCLTRCHCSWILTVVERRRKFNVVEAVWRLGEADHCVASANRDGCVERSNYIEVLRVPLDVEVPATIGGY